MSGINRRIVLARRPHGAPRDEDFRLETVAIPQPGPGEVLVRTLFLSLDPYMRGRMNEAAGYAASVAIGGVMVGSTVDEVVLSHAEGFAPGELVEAPSGWQDYAVLAPHALRKLPPDAPPSTALGVLGMPGMTAWVGLHNIGQPKPGDTLVVAAASGPVGSLVGQIARLRGARAVGIAGGPEKCAYVRRLGFDDCVDHRGPGLPERLAAACPEGIDVYFENVGGAVWDAVLPLLNPFGRVPVCGLVGNSSQTGLPPGPDRTPLLMRAALTKRLLIRGFLVFDFEAQRPDFMAEIAPLLASGQVRHREDVTDGLENAPSAFIGMLKGDNFGKTLVRVAPPAPASG